MALNMAQPLTLKKATRKKAYLKLGMSAPSGGGKTLGSLLLAYGLVKGKYPSMPESEVWGKIAIVDSENGSGELYVNKFVEGSNITIGEYNAITLEEPFTPEKYIQAIEVCESAEIEVCIIDSTTHLWSGKGGLLEQQNNEAKRTGNSWTAWRNITPKHNLFVEKMLQTPMHIIATMRSKTEYVTDKDESGKASVRKLGLSPVQRDGMEYEFTVFIEIDTEHKAFASKDRTSILDGKYFTITPKIGKELIEWLESGSEPTEKPVVIAQHKASPEEAAQNLKKEIIDLCKALGGSGNEDLINLLKTYTPNGNPNSINDPEKLSQLRSELLEMSETKN